MRYLSMKLILSLLLFEIFSWSLSANNSSIIEPDSAFNFQYIKSISFSEPERALRILEQAEEEKRIPQYQVNNLRSCVYQNGLGYIVWLSFIQRKFTGMTPYGNIRKNCLTF